VRQLIRVAQAMPRWIGIELMPAAPMQQECSKAQ
jgi:hypothetical protein